MNNAKSVIKSKHNFTSYKFYTEFLDEVACYYRDSKNSEKTLVLKLFDKGDDDIYNSNYRVDPLVIPLLLSLIEQLSKYHRDKIPLLLYNNPATISALEFLYKCDFFHIAGDNTNPNFPKGRSIVDFDKGFLGAFQGKKLRDEHRVRVYSLEDNNLATTLSQHDTEEEKRDFLVTHFTYKVREHFEELLFENEYTAYLHNTYIDILSELIANAVLHSKSVAYALMFVDRFKTKFSISDNGIGFEKSMDLKEKTFYYEPSSLKKLLNNHNSLKKTISSSILNNLHSIFETLYYSALKDRHGLFDLMINVVLKSQGYFRIHSENSQVVVSNRMMDELKELESHRIEILNSHTDFFLNKITEEAWKNTVKGKSDDLKQCFIKFYEKAVDKYNSDIMYSSLRFFKVKFRGVHVEVEIPNGMTNDSI